MLRVLQVKQCGTRINKIYNVTSLRENTIQENPKAPRMHQEHQEILQSFTLLFKRMVAKLQQNYMREMGESGEKFWYNGVVVITSCQNEEKGLPFKGGKE